MTGLLLLACGFAAQEPPPPATQPKPPKGSTLGLDEIHGDVRVKYRHRWTADGSDSDLYQYLSLTYGNPAADLFSAALSARVAEDLDGERGASGFDAFDSLDDTYDHGTTGRLLAAYFSLNQPIRGLWVRAGRQILDTFPESVPMDGVLVQHSGIKRFSAAAFGGVPVNPFESSPSRDLMYGGWLETVPWAELRARVEYLHVKDVNVFGEFDDDLIGFVLDHRMGAFHLHERYTLLEGEKHEVTVRLASTFAEIGLVVDGQVDYFFERQVTLSYPLDPYSLFLLDLEPYAQSILRASKTLGGPFAVEASVTVRELVDGDDERAYNREFVRWNVTPRADGWPHPTLSLSVMADYWRSTADDFSTLGGDLSWRADPALTCSVGSSYALYAIDVLTGEERERVRAVYAAARLKLGPSLHLDARFAVEDTEIDRFRTVEVGVRHAF